jgi:beta-phosphoglucomutase-like phosphatase (HAD superfamily)
VVEDSSNGILAGHAAGANVIAVPNSQLKTPPDVLSKANVVIDSLVSLNSALELIDGSGQ